MTPRISSTDSPTLAEGVPIDPPQLLLGRLLLQANSGAGKSKTLRRLFEQTYGIYQQIVIDVEGEFSTLREKYDYILFGPGGDYPVSVESAGLLAIRLLETGVSAVINIYELGVRKPEWVKAFLEALVGAPKELWHPAIIALDEAHKFCPEKGEDIAVSTAAVLDLMTLGRKRGFCAWLATQRVAKLHKTATSECNNKMIGRTGQDDIARAGKELGLKGDRAQALRKLRPGQFYVYGPAFSDDVQLVHIGPVQTTHPEAGQQVPRAAPAGAKIRAVFGEFTNIAAEAAKEIKTTEDLRARIRELEARTDAGVDVPRMKQLEEELVLSREECSNLRTSLIDVCDQVASVHDRRDAIKIVRARANDTSKRFEDVIEPPARVPSKPDRREDRRRQDDTTKQRIADQMKPIANGQIALPSMVHAFLAVLAQRGEPMHRSALLMRAGYVAGGTTNSAIAQIIAEGWAENADGWGLIITSRGRTVLGPHTAPPTGHELRARDLAKLKTMQRKFLSVLFDLYPRPVARKDLYARAGYVAGGTVNNAVAILIRTNRAVIPRQGELMASEEYYR